MAALFLSTAWRIFFLLLESENSLHGLKPQIPTGAEEESSGFNHSGLELATHSLHTPVPLFQAIDLATSQANTFTVNPHLESFDSIEQWLTNNTPIN